MINNYLLMQLNEHVFRLVINYAPLVSIDLIVQNEQGYILLGKRLNRPAQGTWFVPGGRVRKNETLDDAFRRLTINELGQAFERAQGEFLGVFEHFYGDSAFGVASGAPNTHYVVLAYQLHLLSTKGGDIPLVQHSEFQWWSPQKATRSEDVHSNTKAYLSHIFRS